MCTHEPHSFVVSSVEVGIGRTLYTCMQEIHDSDNGSATAAAAAVGEEEGGEGSGEGAEVSEGDISQIPREVFVVDTVEKAQQAAARLHALHSANPSMFFACDTEVWESLCGRTVSIQDLRWPHVLHCQRLAGCCTSATTATL